MLTETTLKNLKPKKKSYKVSDRDGLYAVVLPSGSISFRYNYQINGRQETLTLGIWKKQLSLQEAREKLLEAKKLKDSGVSPAVEKKRRKNHVRNDETVQVLMDKYLQQVKWADSTRARRMYVINNEILPRFGRYGISEIQFPDILAVVDEINTVRQAPATAVEFRNLMMALYEFVRARGMEIENLPARIKPSSIHVFEARDRALSGYEIGALYHSMKQVPVTPVMKHALKLLLLTMVRKGELQGATWDEIDFESKTWTIPKERMKMRRPHVVYLSRQAMDILLGLQYMSGGSRYVLPSRYDGDQPLAASTFNKTCNSCVSVAQQKGWDLRKFNPHDLRRTASTLLHEAGFNSDVIEKCLAHEQKGVRAVYNKAEYAQQRRELLQSWANMIDGFVENFDTKIE